MVSVSVMPRIAPWRALKVNDDPNARAWTIVEIEGLKVTRVRVLIVDLYRLTYWDERGGQPQRRIVCKNEVDLVCLLNGLDDEVRPAILRAWSWRLMRVQQQLPVVDASPDEVLDEASRRG